MCPRLLSPLSCGSLKQTTSQRTVSLRLFGVLGLAAMTGVGSFAEAPSPASERRITLEASGVPLTQIADQLSSPAVKLKVGPEFRDTKALVIVRDRPVRQVMSRLAQVFGAHWVKLKAEPGEPAAYQLRRTAEVAQWLKRWKAVRSKALLAAREARAARTRTYMAQLIDKANRTPTRSEGGGEPPGGMVSVELTRLLGTLPPQDFASLSRWVAESSPVHTGGASRDLPCPVRYRFSTLSTRQQAAIRNYVSEAELKNVGPLDEAVVSFRLQNFVKLDVRLPTGRRFGDYLFAYDVRPDEVEGFLHEALLHEMSRGRTPPGALLGAAVTEEAINDSISMQKRTAGRVSPGVRIVGPRVDVELDTVRQPGLLYREFPPILTGAGVSDVVSDFHTLPYRLGTGSHALAPGKQALKDVLEKASTAYRMVFRFEDGFLLARNMHWPDRDEEEVPYPLPETWLDTRRKGGGLSLEQILRIAGCSESQQNGLGAYDDRVVSLKKEVEYVRRNPGLLGVLGSLSRLQRNALQGNNGLPVRTLSQLQQATLLDAWRRSDSGGGPVPPNWRQASLWLYESRVGPSVTRRSLLALVPGSQPFWESVLPTSRPRITR